MFTPESRKMLMMLSPFCAKAVTSLRCENVSTFRNQQKPQRTWLTGWLFAPMETLRQATLKKKKKLKKKPWKKRTRLILWIFFTSFFRANTHLPQCLPLFYLQLHYDIWHYPESISEKQLLERLEIFRK